MSVYGININHFNYNTSSHRLKFGRDGMPLSEVGELRDRITAISISKGFYELLFHLAHPAASQLWPRISIPNHDILSGIMNLERHKKSPILSITPIDKVKALLDMLEITTQHINGDNAKLLKFVEKFDLSPVELGNYDKFEQKFKLSIPTFFPIKLDDERFKKYSFPHAILIAYAIAEHQGTEGGQKFFDELPIEAEKKAELRTRMNVPSKQ